VLTSLRIVILLWRDPPVASRHIAQFGGKSSRASTYAGTGTIYGW